MDWKTLFIITSPIFATLIGVLLNRYFENRPKLIVYLGHMSTFKVRGENESKVYTHSIILRNAGRRAAKNIQIGHNCFPENYDIFPAINHDVRSVPDSSKEIFIPNLVPNEQVTISYLYFEPYTITNIHSAIKYSEGFAKYIHVIQLQQYPKWVTRSFLFLALIGLSTVIYGFYELFLYLMSAFET